jgi:quercetin dioxygenase-like cupin family protein
MTVALRVAGSRVLAALSPCTYSRLNDTGRDAVPNRSMLSVAAAGSIGLLTGYLLASNLSPLAPSFAQAQRGAGGQRTAELFNQVVDDVLGRRLTVRVIERDPGNGSAAHRHPGSHTVGYILEGAYEVKIGDGPVRRLTAGQVFYEPPNALHAVSRNASATESVKYLVIQVSDPSKPATVSE